MNLLYQPNNCIECGDFSTELDFLQTENIYFELDTEKYNSLRK